MSHRALIAERQSDGRFDVYFSRNGAENIQLLDELRESLNIHGRIDWDSLTGTAAPEMARRLTDFPGSEYDVESPDFSMIVEPRPLAVDVPQETVLDASDLLRFEVLYVVDDGDVEAHWLAWAYPDVIRPWRDHLEVDVYDPAKRPEGVDELVEVTEDNDPVRTITKFDQGWLSDDIVREVVRDYHRWLYEMHSMAIRDADEASTDALETGSIVLQTPDYWLEIHSDRGERLVPGSHPFIIPVQIGSPPNLSSTRIREKAAQTRFSIGAGLNAAEEPSLADVRRGVTDAVIAIVDAHADRVATEFIPGELGEAIEEYQQTQSWQRSRDLWKN